MAARNGHLAVVQWLLTPREAEGGGGGARLEERNDHNRTALLVAAHNGHLPLVQWLLVPKEKGTTALLGAAFNGHLPVVQWLLISIASRMCVGWD